jgi:hypothetical protein
MQCHDVTQYNHTLASTSELEGIQAHLHKPPRLKGAQQPIQGRASPLFIAPKPNRDVGAKLHIL